MSEIRSGDFFIVVCALHEETSIHASLREEFGSSVQWSIIGDARIPSGNGYIFNNSLVRRRMGYPEPRDIRKDMCKLHVRSERAIPRV